MNGSIAPMSPTRQGAPIQLRESAEVPAVALALYTADRHLGRVTQSWSALGPAEQQPYFERAAFVIRFGNQAARNDAFEDAARAMRIQHHDVVPTMDVARELASTAIPTWLSVLSGWKGGK